MNRFLFIIFVFSFLLACSTKKERVIIVGETMGTYYKVISFTDANPEKLKKDIDKFLKLFNNVFSTYIKDSEVSKINNTRFNKIKISDSMAKILGVSFDISKRSEGYFDITVGPIVNAWGFGPDKKQKKPSVELINELKSRVGYQNLKIENGFLNFNIKGQYIDLSAIAKGFGVDELVKHLDYQGHRNFLVEIGGEVRARGKKPDGSLWRLGVEGPSKKMGQKIAKVVTLENMAMATSGSYRNFKKYGEEIFQHTIDPITGYPAKHKTVSVTVLHEYCADADAWATALMSMGSEKGLGVANKNDLKVLFQVKVGEDVKLISTKAFEQYIKK